MYVYGGDPGSEEQQFKERQERRRLRRKANRLRRQVQELRLVSMAMFELITEQAQISNEDLIARIDEIDARDGIIDGRLREAGGPPRCTQCKRVLLTPNEQCLYCGPIDPSV